MVDAIILAGGKSKKGLSTLSSDVWEALIDINGKPMVAHVIQALAASEKVGRIFVVGPVDALKKHEIPACAHVVESGDTLIETIQSGVKALGHQKKILVATTDVPLITPESVIDFIQQCEKSNADFYYPLIAKELNRRNYPQTKRTYFSLREGTFTGGNLFMVNPAIIPDCVQVLERIFALRKSPFQLCGLLGWNFVFRFLCRRLSVSQVEERIKEILGITGKAIFSEYPEIGIDVDKPDDLRVVRAVFAKRG